MAMIASRLITETKYFVGREVMKIRLGLMDDPNLTYNPIDLDEIADKYIKSQEFIKSLYTKKRLKELSKDNKFINRTFSDWYDSYINRGYTIV